MSDILVSVILPVYNASTHICASVESVRNQTIENWELIIVDDGSTDDTSIKAGKIKDDRIRLVQLTENLGYPSAVNAGLKIARGKFIARMDADDICLPTRLEEQLKALAQYPKASFCGVNQFKITPGGKRFGKRSVPGEKYMLESWEDLMDNHRLFTDPSVMVEKQKIGAVGGYRTFQRSGMDVDLWLRIMELHGPCVTITTPLYGKRLEPGSIIFDPNTHLRNQVPRALARQRKDTGADDIQQGRTVDIQEYVRRGLIHEGDRNEKMNMLYGALIACLYVRDWKGAAAFWTEIRKDGMLPWGHVGAILKRILKRIEKNPHRTMRSP